MQLFKASYISVSLLGDKFEMPRNSTPELLSAASSSLGLYSSRGDHWPTFLESLFILATFFLGTLGDLGRSGKLLFLVTVGCCPPSSDSALSKSGRLRKFPLFCCCCCFDGGGGGCLYTGGSVGDWSSGRISLGLAGESLKLWVRLGMGVGVLCWLSELLAATWAISMCASSISRPIPSSDRRGLTPLFAGLHFTGTYSPIIQTKQLKHDMLETKHWITDTKFQSAALLTKEISGLILYRENGSNYLHAPCH